MSGITKEMLEERLETLNRELQQLPVLMQTYKGAIQDIQYWLKTLEEAENNTNEIHTS